MQEIKYKDLEIAVEEYYVGGNLTERMNDSLMKYKGDIQVKRTFFKDRKSMIKAAKKARKNNRRK